MFNVKCNKCNEKINFIKIYNFLFLSKKERLVCPKCQYEILDKIKINFLYVEIFIVFIIAPLLALLDFFNIRLALNIFIVFTLVALLSLIYTYYVYKNFLKNKPLE